MINLGINVVAFYSDDILRLGECLHAPKLLKTMFIDSWRHAPLGIW